MRFSELSLEATRAGSAAKFAAAYPDPVLIPIGAALALEGGQSYDTPSRGVRLAAFRPVKVSPDDPGETTHDLDDDAPLGKAGLDEPLKEAILGTGDPEVIRIVKTGRNPFLHMITLGRAATNDIIVEEKSISKVHAYFARLHDGTWEIHDQKSTNGTYVGRTKMEGTGGHPVRDGENVSFGVQLCFRFHTAEGFYKAVVGK
jgi:hypothetical protein